MIRQIIRKILSSIINILIDLEEIIDPSECVTFHDTLIEEGYTECVCCQGLGYVKKNGRTKKRLLVQHVKVKEK